MIYILMEYVPAYEVDNCAKPVFASTSKEVVEKKHDDLMAYFKKYNALFERWHVDVQRINAENPAPSHPDTSNLPRRPLVWKDENWQDYYALDYRERYHWYLKEIEEKTKKLKAEYIEFYKEAEPDIVKLMEDIYTFARIPTYTMEEVESD